VSFDNTLLVRALGTPQPQGSIAFKGMRGGKPVMVSDNANLKPWRAIIAGASHEALPADWQPLDEPVMISATFWLKAPQRPRWRRPAVKPDLDKLVRAVLDGLADGGVLLNDSRVTDFAGIHKRYATPLRPPGCELVIEWGLED
jgi:Holliday junction resolvase RusA-like endonuclease